MNMAFSVQRKTHISRLRLETFKALYLRGSGKAADVLGRFMRVRRRYFLTRSEGLRLRYVAAPLAALVMSVSVLPQFGNHPAGASPHVVSDKGVLGSTSRSHLLARIEPGAGGVSARLSVGRLDEESRAALRKAEPLIPAAYQAVPDFDEPPKPKVKNVEIGKGDAVSVVLQKAGLSSTETFAVIKAMEPHLDPRKIRPGQKISVRFDPSERTEGYEFSEMRVVLDPVRAVVVTPDGDAYRSGIEEKDVHPRLQAQVADIEVSLYGSAAKAGIPSAVIAEAIRIYSWDVDFQRDIRAGDRLEVLYETYVTEDGEFARYGDVLYASLSVGGKAIPVYRYTMKNGDVDYFEPNGRSVRKALMKTPIDGARLSSGYGMRKHPVLGYNKLHKGQDFAAPTGTPIYAAGDGVIEKAGRWSSYGIYTRIRHNSSLKTAYAHQSRLAKGIAPGVRVKQGQVIGYVGTTGRSTGPHLHYEVLHDGNHVNPATLKLPQGSTLTGTELATFKDRMKNLNQQFASMAGGVRLVSGSLDEVAVH